jgi:hypothetical protein
MQQTYLVVAIDGASTVHNFLACRNKLSPKATNTAMNHQRKPVTSPDKMVWIGPSCKASDRWEGLLV